MFAASGGGVLQLDDSVPFGGLVAGFVCETQTTNMGTAQADVGADPPW
jgi:hypothetical protein